MKYKNHRLWLSLSMITTILSGCALENPLDGEICMDEEHPQLSKILLGGGVSCSREKCLSSDHCCTELEIDNNLRKTIFQAFDYNICPKGS